MSWGVSFVGKPEAVAKALDEYSGKLSGQCRIEYDDAKPHLIALVRQKFTTDAGRAKGYGEPGMIALDASGSGSAVNGEQLNRDVQVSIKPFFYGNLVT